ncbi:MAG: hypothetical protein ABIA04_01400 [Pseudomonadota bacterium]
MLQGLTIILGILMIIKCLPAVIWPEKAKVTAEKLLENEFLYKLILMLSTILGSYILASSFYDSVALEGFIIFLGIYMLVWGVLGIVYPKIIKDLWTYFEKQPPLFMKIGSGVGAALGLLVLICGII